jgi:ribosomal protein L37AE/L43A
MKNHEKYYCPVCNGILKLMGIRNDVGFIFTCSTPKCNFKCNKKTFKPYGLPEEKEFAREYESVWIGDEKKNG